MSKDAVKKAARSAKESKKKENSVLTKQAAINQALDLVEKSHLCLVGTNGEDGFPNIRAMTNRRHEGLKTIWLGTDTSSKKVQQLKKDNRACVYYIDTKLFKGLTLVGNIEILQDLESKRMLWKEGSEVYYPQGVEDPEYTVLRFTARRGAFYHALKNKKITFEIE